MVDFLRSNPWCSRDEYMWQMTVGQVRLSSFDFSRVEYGKDKKKKKKMTAGEWLMRRGVSEEEERNTDDLGRKIINR